MALQASKVQVGDTYTQELTDDLSRTQIVQYAGASGDYNPPALGRDLHDQGGEVPDRLRPRHADDGHDPAGW